VNESTKKKYQEPPFLFVCLKDIELSRYAKSQMQHGLETSTSTPASCLTANPQVPSPSPSREAVPSSNMASAYYCHSCCKPFRKQHEFNKHKKIHLRPYRCGFDAFGSCQKGFASNRDLQRHVQSRHPHPQMKNSNRFYCDQNDCDWSVNGTQAGFLRKDSLLRHIKRHGGKR